MLKEIRKENLIKTRNERSLNMKEKNRNKYLKKNIFIFAIGNFATKFITFFLVPLYTLCLTTTEYGKADLLYTICTFLYPLLTLNISEAIFRFSMDKDINKKNVLFIGFICTFFGIVLGIISIPIMKLLFGYDNFSYIFYLYLATMILSQTLLVCLKGNEKLKEFTIGNFINTLFVAIFNILFLLKFDMRINGYFLSYIISNIIVIFYTLIVGNFVKDSKGCNFDKNLFKKMTKYSVVLIPTSFMWWIINSSDRIMITSMISLAANGIYAVSYKIPSLLTIIASIFNQAWVFSAINEKDSKDNDIYTNNVFKNLFMIIILTGMFILIIIKPLFKIYVTVEYYTAWKYVPFLIFGFVFMTSATFISTSYNVHKDSKGFLISGFVGAVSNIILNFILIPIFGVYGAALATSISYIIVFLYRIFDTKKYLKINFRIEYFIWIISLFICCLFTYINNLYGILLQIILLFILLIINRKNILFLLKEILIKKNKKEVK